MHALKKEFIINKHFSFFAFLLGICLITSSAKSQTKWTSFYNVDSTAIGFKDARGIVQIEPKFTGFTQVNNFDYIIAVAEKINDQWNSYYLTKSGKQIGTDSLYVFDFTFDCESEGFIRFQDPKTQKIGLFNKEGKVQIPAIYDGLTAVNNGLLIGLQGAKKVYWDKDKHEGCNHFSWEGGKEVLINTLNHVLVENFPLTTDLNFYDVKASKTANPSHNRTSFKTTDGTYLSFIDYKKEFNHWFFATFLNNLNENDVVQNTHDIIVWESPDEWVYEKKETFITRNYEVLHSELKSFTDANADYFISLDGLNSLIYKDENYAAYFDNCGNALVEKYPLINLVINKKNNDTQVQNHFDFLRTPSGYQLISVTIRNQILK